MEKKPSSCKSCSAKKLPSYVHPPVNEVVCGVRFEPSSKFTLPYIGLLWNKFRERYPRVEHAPPLAVGPNQILVDTVTGAPLPRVWFINTQGDQLIQFQTDRIYFNWRQRKNAYPRYESVIRNFEEVLDMIEAFFKESELGKFIPVECELSYVNHISRRVGQDTVEEHHRVFRDFQWNKPHCFLPNPSKIAWSTRYSLPEKKGNLSVVFKEGTLKEDNKPVFILDLTARGIGQASDRGGIREWFDTAHVWIVCGFTDLTTETIQVEEWEREDAPD
jgi:uncharacterized protein (TIGR04255 family)